MGFSCCQPIAFYIKTKASIPPHETSATAYGAGIATEYDVGRPVFERFLEWKGTGTMRRNNPTEYLSNAVHQPGGLMRTIVPSVFLLFLFVSALPFWAADPTYPISTDVQTTRQRTVRPVPLPDVQPYLTITEVDQYGPRGYSAVGVWRPRRRRRALAGRHRSREHTTRPKRF